MESKSVISAFAALAQPTRLDVFRLLVQHEPQGLAAGEIARLLSVPQNTMSSHLAILAQADLASAKRSGRSIVYRANLDYLQHVIVFMLKDCCGGKSGICAPLIENLTRARPAKKIRPAT
jgi:DNA-binding transcriptional ArsR family regulator